MTEFIIKINAKENCIFGTGDFVNLKLDSDLNTERIVRIIYDLIVNNKEINNE